MTIDTVAKPTVDDATGQIDWVAPANPDGFEPLFYRVYRVGTTEPIGHTKALTWTAAGHTSGDAYQIEAASHGGLASSAAKSPAGGGGVDVITISTNSTNATYSISLQMLGGFPNPIWTEPDGTTTQTGWVFNYDFTGNTGIETFTADVDLLSVDFVSWGYKDITSLEFPAGDPGISNLSIHGNALLDFDFSVISGWANLTKVRCDFNGGSFFASHITGLTNLIEINAASQQTTATEVDDIIIEVESWGTSNGILNLAGSSPIPTAASATARSNLTARNWTTTYST